MAFYDNFKHVIDWFIFILAFGFFAFFLPLMALFGFRGAESAFNRELVTFYYGLGIITVILISVGELAQFASKFSPKIYNAIGWLGSIIHNPEMALLWNKQKQRFFKGFRWSQKTLILLWVGIIFFPIIGIFQVVNNTFLVDLPHIAQQILPIGEAILEVEPSGTEIFGLVFLVGLNMFIWRYVQKRNGFDDFIYWVITIPTSIVVGVVFYGLPLHFFRYAGSDQSLFGVAIFWFLAVMLLILFGNIFIVWLFKDVNNLFKFLNGKYSDDTIIVYTGIIIGIIAVVRIFIWLIRRERNKKKIINFLDFG